MKKGNIDKVDGTLLSANKRARKDEHVNYQSNFLSMSGFPFTEFQYNIFFAVIHQINKYRDQAVSSPGSEFATSLMVKFNPNDIPGFKIVKNKKRITDDVDSITGIKIINDIEGEGGSYIVNRSVLFTSAKYESKSGTVSVGINPGFINHFRHLKNKYNQYFLEEAISIRGRYAKALYLAINANAYRNEWIPPIGRLRTILQCPKSYTASHIIEKAIIPLQESLKSSKRVSFSYHPIRQGKNHKITKIVFKKIHVRNMPKHGDLSQKWSKEKLFDRMQDELIGFLQSAGKEDIAIDLFKRMYYCPDSIQKSKVLKVRVSGCNCKEDFEKYDASIHNYNDYWKPVFYKYFPDHILNYSMPVKPN